MKVDHCVHKVSVPLVNVIQDISGNTIAADWVMLRVDVEGPWALVDDALVPGNV